MHARAATRLIAATAALLLGPGAAYAAQLSKIGDFSSPTYVTAPPGDPHRLFVVEKGGTIEVLHDGVRKRFLDLSGDAVTTGEQGLLSMAFAPDYKTSGRFYVYYTAPRDPSTGDTTGSVLTVAEYHRSAADADRADPAGRVVIAIDHPVNSNHNGGQLEFGPDGLLYMGTGDGGSGNDPPNNAQNPGVLLGKLLRIDPRPTATAQYRVPVDNPFVGRPGADEVYAYGLRNPWRFSFDRLTGDLVIGDVGEQTREEVDFSPRGTAAGVDYGWRCMEGTIHTPALVPQCSPAEPYVAPVFEYDHTAGCAITGGYVVRNHDLNSLYGRYVYADYCAGDIRSMALARPTVTDETSTGLAFNHPYSFGEDSCGHLYVSNGDGQVDVLIDSAFTPCPEPPPETGKPPARDVRPPKLRLSRKRTQRLSRHRSLYVTLRCDERCGVTASATFSVAGLARVFKVPRVTYSLSAGRSIRLRLLLTPRSAAVARKALRSGRRVRAKLTAVARDAAGNRTVVSAPVRVLL